MVPTTPKAVKALMQTSTQKTFKTLLQGQSGFSLIEIMVALLLAALVFLAIPSGDSARNHRILKTTIDNLERSIRFAANESVLRNTVCRLRLDLDKEPVEWTVEYGPAGNIPLPEMSEKTDLSLAEEKAQLDKAAKIDKEFTKVEEFEEIKQEIPQEVSIIGVATTGIKGIKQKGTANIYFYPTGEKDGALVFLSTIEEVAHIEVSPFLSDIKSVFFTLNAQSVAKFKDLLQTRMDEVYREWGK